MILTAPESGMPFEAAGFAVRTYLQAVGRRIVSS